MLAPRKSTLMPSVAMGSSSPSIKIIMRVLFYSLSPPVWSDAASQRASLKCRVWDESGPGDTQSAVAPTKSRSPAAPSGRESHNGALWKTTDQNVSPAGTVHCGAIPTQFSGSVSLWKRAHKREFNNYKGNNHNNSIWSSLRMCQLLRLCGVANSYPVGRDSRIKGRNSKYLQIHIVEYLKEFSRRKTSLR